jgi:hypothetical protein
MQGMCRGEGVKRKQKAESSENLRVQNYRVQGSVTASGGKISTPRWYLNPAS